MSTAKLSKYDAFLLPNNRQLLQSKRYDGNHRVLHQVRENDLIVTGYCREQISMDIPTEIANYIAMYHLYIFAKLVAVEGTFKVTPMNEYNSGYSLVATSSFPTRRSDICIPKKIGKYYYEFIVDELGRGTQLGQIGWMTEKSATNASDSLQTGVGDDNYSWAFDGGRCKTWHGRNRAEYGTHWRKGDVIGCCLDLFKMHAQYVYFHLSYTMNGKSLGMAFEDCKYHWNSSLYPAFSTQRDRTNGTIVFDAEELQFMPDGYQSIC